MTDTTDRRAWLALVVLAGVFGVVSLSFSVMNVAFDAIADEWPDTSTAALGWVLTGYMTTTAALLIASGRIADAFGHRRVFLLGLVVFLVTSVLGAVAWSPAALIAARFGQGVGGALVTPTSLAILLTVFPAERRSAVIGIWGSVGAVAAAGGPAFGGLAVDTLGWRSVFWFNVPLCIAAWLGARAWLDDDSEMAEGKMPDPVGIVLSTAAVGSLALGLAQTGEWGWGDPRTIAALVAGPVFAGMLVFRSMHHDTPVLDLDLFRLRSFTVGNLVTLVFNIGFSAMVLSNVLYLSRVWGYSQAGAGFGIAPSPISAAIVAPIAGRLADRVGTRAMVVPGILLFSGGLLYLALGVGTEAHYWSQWFPAALCFGTGVGMVFTNVSSASVADAPLNRLAIASASNGTARSIGTVLGPAFVVGTVGAATGVAAADEFDRVWLVAAAISLLSAAIAWFLPRKRPMI